MLAAIAIALAVQSSPAPAYWGDLKPGPFPVGFTQAWIVDSTRRLPQGEKYALRYRPILLNVWYPARSSGAAIAYDDYFAGAVRAAGSNPGIRNYATALIDYQRNTAWRELAKAERDSTEAGMARRIEALFRSRSFAHRDAPRAKLSGQVVVYTAGSGSSMDDNLVLCEYLASLGYTVVGSAFPQEDNSSFATFVADRSRPRDIARLLAELPRRGFPVRHVTAIGHSAGAQAMQWFAADPSAPIDAVLSLDTTEDYSMLSDRSWVYYTADLVANRSGVRLPIMFVADRSALFELADSLSHSARTLLTVPEIGHNDFISQGNIRRQLLTGLSAADSAERVTSARTYQALLEYSGEWIKAVGAAAPVPTPAATELRVEIVPVGEKAPALGADPLRTARAIRHLFATESSENFARRALQARTADRDIVTNQVLMMLLVDAIRKGAPERARQAYRSLVAGDSTLRAIPDRMLSRAQLFESIGAKDLAADWRTLGQSLTGSGSTPP